MSESKTEATQYKCDADSCGVVHVTVGEQEPAGRRLTTQLPYGVPLAVYACKATHIRPAIEAVEEAVAKAAEAEDVVEEDPRTDAERDADEQFAAGKEQLADEDDETVNAVNDAFARDLDEAMGAPAATL